MLCHYVLVAIGGALGSMARYWLSGLVHRFSPSTFPYGTFTVNVVGCLAFGLLMALSEQRSVLSPASRVFVFVGVLGGFTTFSALSFETFTLLRDGEILLAAVNVAGQAVLGVLALWCGYRVMMAG